jgi:phosphate transport system substrate-binding protein
MKHMLALAAVATVALMGDAQARDEIRIVGSSTVFPFATSVAEQFGKGGQFKTPVVESTGTGGGLKLFCAGVGEGHPDIANASRKIKDSELAECAENGVTEITEIKIGFDGIVIANSKNAPPLSLTLDKIYLALAKEVPNGETGFGFRAVTNGYKMWSDIDPALPQQEIHVYGPPPTSGTRDAFLELAMDPGCLTFAPIKELKGVGKGGEKRAKAICQTMREDGAYVDAGENDNLIVQKLAADPAAFGIFGYSFLEQNADKVQGAALNGVTPTFEAIASGEYPVSRPLYIYVKNAHASVIPGLKEYVAEFTSDKAMGAEGYLAAKGLIPLPDEERAKVQEVAQSLISADELKFLSHDREMAVATVVRASDCPHRSVHNQFSSMKPT